jgi:FkbM family methyltransferase
MISILRRILRQPISRRNRRAALERFFRWQLGSRLLRAPVVYPFVSSTSLIVRTGMHGATINVYSGLGDFSEMGFLLHSLRPDDVFLDVGANIGAYTILASGVSGARSYLFEPSAESIVWASKNIRLNDLSDKVRIRQVAVGATKGTVTFSSMADSSTNCVVSGAEGRGPTVELTTLDSELAGIKPSLMKMDVEGFEGEALKGAQQILNEKSLYGIIIELAGHGEKYGHDERSIVQNLISLGFVTAAYDPFTRTLVEEPVDSGSKNKLFVRDFETVRRRLKEGPSFTVCGLTI